MAKNEINFGEYTVAKSWDEVTLLQWQNYVRKVAESEDNEIDLIDTVVAFSDIPKDVLLQCPTDLFETIVGHLKWLNDDFDKDPFDKVNIDGEDYIINIMEKLKVQEYNDVNTIIEADKFNYSMIFAVLCRKPNEVYNDDFISNVLPSRIKMFENLPVSKAYGLISFFLLCYLESSQVSQSYSMVAELNEEVAELARNTRSLLKHTDFTTRFNPRLIMRLRKLEKSINSISQLISNS